MLALLERNGNLASLKSNLGNGLTGLMGISMKPDIHFHEHMACTVINPDTGVSLDYRHLIQGLDKDIWVKALANDFGRLAQGLKDRMQTGNSTIFFIHPSKIPSHKIVTYGRLFVEI